MWRSKVKTLDSRIKLYQCLSKSMLTYCSTAWSIDHIDKLEIFQNNFIRRLLNLLRRSLNWYGRLELNCDSIEYDYMKNLLYFWKRLFFRPRDSLLWICYNQLRTHCDNLNMKYNWYRSFRSLLEKWECFDILDIATSTEDPSYLKVRNRVNIVIYLRPSLKNAILLQRNLVHLCLYLNMLRHTLKQKVTLIHLQTGTMLSLSHN
jgi:hypothetical protein